MYRLSLTLCFLITLLPVTAEGQAPDAEIMEIERRIDSLQNRLVELRARQTGANTGVTVENATLWYGDELEKVKDVIEPGVRLEVQALIHDSTWGEGHYFWRVITPKGLNGYVFATEVAGEEIRQEHPEAPPPNP